jgi:hypothetical protein
VNALDLIGSLEVPEVRALVLAVGIGARIAALLQPVALKPVPVRAPNSPSRLRSQSFSRIRKRSLSLRGERLCGDSEFALVFQFGPKSPYFVFEREVVRHFVPLD